MTENGSAKAYNDHNVYILGAGFSAEAGMPLMRGFMNRMKDAQAWLDGEANRKEEIAAIKSVLDFRAEAAAAAYRVPLDLENIEELFSLASASGSTHLSEEVTRAIAATIDYCHATGPRLSPIFVTRLADAKWEKPPNWQFKHHLKDCYGPTAKGSVYSCPLYEFLLGLMCGYFDRGGTDRRDTIISFNYDTIVEDALSGSNLPFCYAEDQMIEWRPPRPWTDVDRRPIPVLKLHGSVNLSAQRRKDLDVLQLLAYPSYQDLRREGLWPMLVAPTWQKSLGGYLSAVWPEAVSALRTATRVVILGYSVPQTDQHFKYLLAAGLQENISLRKVLIVNPDESEQFKQHLSSLFRAEHFD
ncbi:MAG: SIR2 family protein [Terriglobia bacterium]